MYEIHKNYSATLKKNLWLLAEKHIQKIYPGSSADMQDIMRKVCKNRSFFCLNINEMTAEFLNELFSFSKN